MSGQPVNVGRPTQPSLQEQERSAFIAFAEFASEHVLEPHEVRGLVSRMWSLKPSLFHISQRALEELGPALGLDQGTWERAFGRDVLSDTATKVFVGDLRHCPVCLSKGCHSALFQLPAVAYCPVHSVRLRCGCPRCGAAVPVSALSVGRNHLYCARCGGNMAPDRRRDIQAGEVLMLPSKRFDAMRAALLNVDAEERSNVKLDLPPAQIASSPALSRLLASHTVWFNEPTAGFERFRVEHVPLGPTEATASSSRSDAIVRNAYINAFVELARELEKYVRLDAMPAGAESGTHSGARVDADLNLICAAFWHAAATFGVHRYVCGEMPPPTARASPFAFALPRGTQAMRHVASRQAQSLFVLNVLRFSRLQYGAQVAWSETPATARFLVPWRICRAGHGDDLELQVRTRVESATIGRIVMRHRYRRLQKVPSNVDLTAFLGESAGGAGGAR